MAFDENQLATDITDALSLPVEDGDDATKQTISEIATAIAAAIAANPAIMVLANEVRIGTAEDDLRALTDQVGELQEFVDSIEQRTSTVEGKISKFNNA
mgnify:CR=1 FL=1